MYFRRSLALGAVVLSTACEVPVDTGASNPDLGVASVAIQPKIAMVLVGDSLPMSASVVMSNNRPPNSVTWASANSGIATVDGWGVVRGRSAGALFIHATSGSKRDSAAVTVVDPAPVPVASVSVAPSSVTVTVGGTVSLVASLKDANGNTLSGRAITWRSSNTGVAAVSGAGLVTAAAAGSAAITATSEGQSGTASVSVTAVPVSVASVTVSPATASVQAGQTFQLTATPKDANGSALSGRTVTWTSSNGGVATVSGTGLVSGVAAGSATITAMSEGQSGSATIAVTAPVSPPGTVGDLTVVTTTDSSVTLRFTEVDGGTGAPASYDIRYVAGSAVSWGANTTSVNKGTCAMPVVGTAVGASRTCTVLGLASSTTYSFELVAFRGTLNVNAVFGALSNIATGTTPASTAAVASVTLSPSPASVRIGAILQLTATLKDAGGNVLSGRTVTWASDNAGIATVGSAGLVTGVVAGSATITATSEGRSGSAPVSVVASSQPGQVTYYRTNFNDGTTGPLDVYGSGSCAASSDYHDPGSAYGMRCTATGTHAAALQAWFGNGRLANQPLDPSLDQDLFEEVRFVLAPGAAAAIGGTSCNSSNANSQFKVHKSVYGQAGSAWNGWVMSEIAPCSDGNIGLFSEAEMWNQDGREYVWPGTYPSLNEGKVYDIVYRYHRYTAQGCGTFAMWVNGTKLMDTPCWSYMGTTNGSGQGLLFWDGLTYVQNSLSPLTVYTLFAQATNYPVGAGTASQ